MFMVKCKIKISSWHFVITNYDVFNTVTKEREGCYKAGSFKIFPNSAYCKEYNKHRPLSFLDILKANSEKHFAPLKENDYKLSYLQERKLDRISQSTEEKSVH